MCEAVIRSMCRPFTPRHSFRSCGQAWPSLQRNLNNDQKWVDRATVTEWEAEDPAKSPRRINVQAYGATLKIVARETGTDIEIARRMD